MELIKTEHELKRKEHQGILAQAKEKADKIRDRESHAEACSYAVIIKRARKAWHEKFDPVYRQAKNAYDLVRDFRDEVDKPLKDAETKILKPAIGKWELEQEKLRQKKEASMKEKTGVEVTLPKDKVSGIGSRAKWSAEIVDKKAFINAVANGVIPDVAVEANMSVINKMASTFKSSLNWPGVKIKEDRMISVRTK